MYRQKNHLVGGYIIGGYRDNNGIIIGGYRDNNGIINMTFGGYRDNNGIILSIYYLVGALEPWKFDFPYMGCHPSH